MRIATLLALALSASPAWADAPLTWGEKNQGELSVMGTWSTGLALGESHDFTPKYGFIGFNGEFMYHVASSVSIGIGSGYQLFTGQERETIESDNAAINAYQFRYLDVVPIMAVGRYYLDVSDDVTLFGALGLGTVYTNRVVDISIVAVHDDTWHFGLAPHIGALIHTPGPDGVIDVKYTYAPGGSEYPTEMWFTAEIGLLFD